MRIASAAAALVKAIGFVAVLLVKAIGFVALLLLKIIGIVAVLLVKAIGFMIRFMRRENAEEGSGDAEPRVLVREHTRAWPGSKS